MHEKSTTLFNFLQDVIWAATRFWRAVLARVPLQERGQRASIASVSFGAVALPTGARRPLAGNVRLFTRHYNSVPTLLTYPAEVAGGKRYAGIKGNKAFSPEHERLSRSPAERIGHCSPCRKPSLTCAVPAVYRLGEMGWKLVPLPNSL